MTVYFVILLTVLTHTAFKGSKVAISLYAIQFGATPFEIGVLFSMYSVFPVVLSLYAGKISDRLGARLPMLFGAGGLTIGLLLPFVFPRLGSLYASAVLIGMCYIFYTVSIQHLIGAAGEGRERTRNYSIYSVGVAVTAMLGPTTAGFAIDLIGHRHTYLLLAVLPGLPFVALLAFRSIAIPLTAIAVNLASTLAQQAPGGEAAAVAELGEVHFDARGAAELAGERGGLVARLEADHLVARRERAVRDYAAPFDQSGHKRVP